MKIVPKIELPTPEEVGIKPAAVLHRDKYEAGFKHALMGDNLTDPEHLKRSFCEGFRAGKLYLRKLHQERGIYSFPMTGKIKIKAIP